MIRLLLPDELPTVAPLAKWFHERMGGRDFNTDNFCTSFGKMILDGCGGVLARFAENGPEEAIGYMMYPDPFNGHISVGTFFWYFLHEPEGLQGGLLYQQFEATARELGAHAVSISVLVNERMPKVAAFLNHSGYELTEMHYRKDLCQSLPQPLP